MNDGDKINIGATDKQIIISFNGHSSRNSSIKMLKKLSKFTVFHKTTTVWPKINGYNLKNTFLNKNRNAHFCCIVL